LFKGQNHHSRAGTSRNGAGKTAPQKNGTEPGSVSKTSHQKEGATTTTTTEASTVIVAAVAAAAASVAAPTLAASSHHAVVASRDGKSRRIGGGGAKEGSKSRAREPPILQQQPGAMAVAGINSVDAGSPPSSSITTISSLGRIRRSIPTNDMRSSEEEDEEEEQKEEEERKKSNNDSDDIDDDNHTFTVEAVLVEEGRTNYEEDRKALEDKIRQELLQNTVTGQVATIVFDEDHDDKGLPLSSYSSNSLSNVGCFKNCCTLKGILMIGFVVLIVVVASILVSRKETTFYGDREEHEEGGAALLTVVPSTLPSTYPSVAPSINIVNLDNRLFDQAHPLTLRSKNGPLQASLSTAIDQQVQFDCGYQQELTLPGLWYTYRARVSGPVTIVTCGPAVTIMNVFQYIDNDDDDDDTTTTTTTTTTTGGRTVLSCLLTYFQNGDVGQCGGDSISWNADQDQVYFVLMSPELVDVNGTNSTNGTMTTTTTNATMANDNEDEESDMSFTIQIVDNDQCAYAFGRAKLPDFLVGAPPLIPTTVESVLSYTTVHATPDNTDVVSSSCGGASASASPGVWYLLQGDGRAYTVSTCASTTTTTTTTTMTTTTLLDTQISVFRGDDCNSLTCVNGNNDYCGLQSTVVWQTTAGDTYYILVHGSYPNSTGTFTLTIAVDTPRRDNDFCETAMALFPAEGEVVTFAFAGASTDPDLPQCRPNEDETSTSTSTTAPVNNEVPIGIWYSIVGTGQSLAVAVSYTNTSPVTMTIYEGTCGSLVCSTDSTSVVAVVGSAVVSEFDVTACIATIEDKVYHVFLSTGISWEGTMEDEHSLVISSC
jgi:hypothetical protein